jgi:hypothetical protein
MADVILVAAEVVVMMMTEDVGMTEEVEEDMIEEVTGGDPVAGGTAPILEEDIENAAKIDMNAVATEEAVAELLPQNEENELQAQALRIVTENNAEAHTVPPPRIETENNAAPQMENPPSAKEQALHRILLE